MRVHWSLKIKLYGKYNVDELKKKIDLMSLKTTQEKEAYLERLRQKEREQFLKTGQREQNLTELMLIQEKEIPVLI